MYLGIKDILIITNPNEINLFKNLLGDGKILELILVTKYKINLKD